MSEQTTKQALIETLAAIEHERWADWQRWVHNRTWLHNCNALSEAAVIRQPDWDRWERQIATPYADLSEREKESDREQVARYWPVIVGFVADWLEQDGREYLAAAWRDEMA